MSEMCPERIMPIDTDMTFLPPEERDKAFMNKYGMTFAEWQKANPPPTDEEIHKMIMNGIKKE